MIERTCGISLPEEGGSPRGSSAVTGCWPRNTAERRPRGAGGKEARSPRRAFAAGRINGGAKLRKGGKCMEQLRILRAGFKIIIMLILLIIITTTPAAAGETESSAGKKAAGGGSGVQPSKGWRPGWGAGGAPRCPHRSPFPVFTTAADLARRQPPVNLPPAAAGLAPGHTLFLERAARPGAESRATPAHRAVAPPGLPPAPPKEPKCWWGKKEGLIFVTCVLVRVRIYVIFLTHTHRHTPPPLKKGGRQNKTEKAQLCYENFRGQAAATSPGRPPPPSCPPPRPPSPLVCKVTA